MNPPVVISIRRYRPPSRWRVLIDCGCGTREFFGRTKESALREAIEHIPMLRWPDECVDQATEAAITDVRRREGENDGDENDRSV